MVFNLNIDFLSNVQSLIEHLDFLCHISMFRAGDLLTGRPGYSEDFNSSGGVPISSGGGSGPLLALVKRNVMRRAEEAQTLQKPSIFGRRGLFLLLSEGVS